MWLGTRAPDRPLNNIGYDVWLVGEVSVLATIDPQPKSSSESAHTCLKSENSLSARTRMQPREAEPQVSFSLRATPTIPTELWHNGPELDSYCCNWSLANLLWTMPLFNRPCAQTWLSPRAACLWRRVLHPLPPTSRRSCSSGTSGWDHYWPAAFIEAPGV